MLFNVSKNPKLLKGKTLKEYSRFGPLSYNAPWEIFKQTIGVRITE